MSASRKQGPPTLIVELSAALRQLRSRCGNATMEAKTTMLARAMLNNAAVDPERLKVISVAFDEAWDRISGKYGHDQLAIDAARAALASAILVCAAKQATSDAETMISSALRLLTQ